MKSLIYIFLFSVLLVCSSHAQEYKTDIFAQYKVLNTPVKVTIFQDERIAVLMNKYVATTSKGSKINGWRIRVYSDLGNFAREKSQEVKAQILKDYNIPVYWEYSAPYFKVYVGDFRNKNEAYRVLRIIRKDFPSAFPVPMQVNFPDLDNTNLKNNE